STGIVRVSSLSQNIGIMTAANAAALRLLGVSKREALGKDVNIIVPEPIAAIHPAMLVQYNSNGEDVIVNTSRIYFIKHRGGYVFPAKVNVCPQESEWVAAVEELQTSLSFVWFVGSPDNWQLVGSCKKAMTALNLEPNMMASGTIPVDRIIPNVDDVVARLQGRESGDFVRLNCLDTTDIAMSSSSVLGTDGHRNKKNGNGKRAGASAAPAHLVVHGKLQVIVLAMLDVPLYILRYRIASETEARVFDSTVVLSGRSAPLSVRPMTSSRVLSSRSFGGGAAGMKMPGGGHGAGGDISLCPVMRSIKPAAAASASGAGSHARVHAAENPHAVSASGNPSRGGSSEEVSESESESDGDERTHMLQRGRQGRTGRATIAVGAAGKRGSASASRSAVAAVGARSATSQKRASAALPSPSPRSDSEEEEDMGSGEATGSEQEEGSDAGDSADAANGSEDEDVLASEVKRAPPRPALATTPGSRRAGTNGDVQ
ncbi:PAS domain S-box protein, partial [archaeon]